MGVSPCVKPWSSTSPSSAFCVRMFCRGNQSMLRGGMHCVFWLIAFTLPSVSPLLATMLPCTTSFFITHQGSSGMAICWEGHVRVLRLCMPPTNLWVDVTVAFLQTSAPLPCTKYLCGMHAYLGFGAKGTSIPFDGLRRYPHYPHHDMGSAIFVKHISLYFLQVFAHLLLYEYKVYKWHICCCISIKFINVHESHYIVRKCFHM